jgi:hypothetical protein
MTQRIIYVDQHGFQLEFDQQEFDWPYPVSLVIILAGGSK